MQWSVKLLVSTTIHWSAHVSVFLDGPEMGKTVTTEEEGHHDYDEDDLPDYSMLKFANQSAQLFSSASDGMFQYIGIHFHTPKEFLKREKLGLCRMRGTSLEHFTKARFTFAIKSCMLDV